MSLEISDQCLIEDIILSHDCRGVSALRPFLPSSYCKEAAQFILDRSKASHKTAIITSGFFILSAQAAETDGTPGATALAKALDYLGFEVVYVTDRYATLFFNLDGTRPAQVIEFPITDHATSRNFAQKILNELKPAIIIAIERCGLTSSNRHLNMKGKDISDFTAKIDYLFLGQENTLGIGDGGNEIGMGNLASQVKAVPSLPDDPALTPTSQLVISSVSNWGAYGLVAALSQLCQCDLLPSATWEQELLQELVARGAVDGFTGENTCAVDAFDAEQNAWALTHLKQLLQQDAIAQPS
jgi:hypothetical protein